MGMPNAIARVDYYCVKEISSLMKMDVFHAGLPFSHQGCKWTIFVSKSDICGWQEEMFSLPWIQLGIKRLTAMRFLILSELLC